MTVRRLVLVMLGALLLVPGCGDDGDDTFTGAVCSSVATWMNDMVETTNQFSDDSPDLSVADRKARYLKTFEELAAVTNKLHDELEDAPTKGVDTADADEMRTLLIGATEEIQRDLAENHAVSAALPDSAYEAYSVPGGKLFPSTEKAMSTVLKTMNEQAHALGIDGLGGSCGRL